MEKTAEVLEKLNDFVKSQTVTGDPIKMSPEVTVIPFTKVGFGLGTGKVKGNDMVGLGGSVEPVGFLIVNKGEVYFLTTGEKGSIPAKLIDIAQDVVRKVVQKHGEDE